MGRERDDAAGQAGAALMRSGRRRRAPHMPSGRAHHEVDRGREAGVETSCRRRDSCGACLRSRTTRRARGRPPWAYPAQRHLHLLRDHLRARDDDAQLRGGARGARVGAAGPSNVPVSEATPRAPTPEADEKRYADRHCRRWQSRRSRLRWSRRADLIDPVRRPSRWGPTAGGDPPDSIDASRPRHQRAAHSNERPERPGSRSPAETLDRAARRCRPGPGPSHGDGRRRGRRCRSRPCTPGLSAVVATGTSAAREPGSKKQNVPFSATGGPE